MLIYVNNGKITGLNPKIDQAEANYYLNDWTLWRDDLTIDDFPGWGELDYFINAAGEISSQPKDIILPEPSEMEVLTAKVDYISMVVEGLVMVNV